MTLFKSLIQQSINGKGLNSWLHVIHESRVIQNQLSLLGMFILCMSHVVLAHKRFITRGHLSTESLLSQEGKGMLGRRKGWASTKGPQPSRRAPQFQRIWNVRTATVLDGSSFGANHRIFFFWFASETSSKKKRGRWKSWYFYLLLASSLNKWFGLWLIGSEMSLCFALFLKIENVSHF